MQKLIPVALLTLLAPLLMLAALLFPNGTGTAQEPVELGADTDPDGNTATFVGTRDDCVSVDAGDTFEFDIFVSHVDNLVAWELYLRFDSSIIEVVDADMHMFLANNPRSKLIKKWVPVSDGQHFLGAADRKLLGVSGSGVLARLTLRAMAPGISAAEFTYRDVDGDGNVDIGPRLTDSGGIAVGDVTGDGVFDGPTYHALIAVGESCPIATAIPSLPPSPPPSPPPQPGGGTSNPSDTSPAQPGGGATPPDTSPPTYVLAVPGDPTFEPPPNTPPSTDDNGPQSENSENSTPQGEPEGPSETGPDDEDVEGSATDGSAPDGNGEEHASAAVPLTGERTPVPPESDDTSAPAPAGGSSTSFSPGGGFPLWAVGSIAAAVLMAATGGSVFMVARAGGRFWR